MSVIDSDVHLIQRADDSDIRVLMGKPYSNDSYPVFPGTGMGCHLLRSRRMGHASPAYRNGSARHRPLDRHADSSLAREPDSQSRTANRIPPPDPRQQFLAAAYCRAYNNHVANICAESGRLKAVGIAPFQDVAAAVAEVSRAVKELGLLGIVVSSLGLAEHLGSRTFWPIYDELQNLKVPLIVHNLSHQVPTGQRYPDSFLFQDTVGGSMETLHAFTGLMYGGVAEKFPALRIAFFNIGVGWLPYMLERMDKDFASHGAEQAPLLKQSPSAYVKLGRWYYSTMGDEGTLPYVLECIGDDVVVFGSGYPDADSPFPLAVANIRTREDISEEAKEKFSAGTRASIWLAVTLWSGTFRPGDTKMIAKKLSQNSFKWLLASFFSLVIRVCRFGALRARPQRRPSPRVLQL